MQMHDDQAIEKINSSCTIRKKITHNVLAEVFVNMSVVLSKLKNKNRKQNKKQWNESISTRCHQNPLNAQLNMMRRCCTVSVPSGSLQVQENRSQLLQGPAGVLSWRPDQPNCADCSSRRCHLCCPGSRWQEQRKLSGFTRPSVPQVHLILIKQHIAKKTQKSLCPSLLLQPSQSEEPKTKYESKRLFLPD